jgi:protein arginine N-methyltransferase 1
MDQLWVRPGSVDATIGQPTPLVEIDLATVDADRPIAQDHVVERIAEADGIVDGVCVWFEARFDDQTTLSTSPLAPQTSWGNRLFRLDHDITAGEKIRLHVHLAQTEDPNTWTVERL